MARITVEDCLKKVNNRFVLINMVAKRVRQIREGSEYLVNSPKNEDIVVALREVAAGKVKIRDPRVPEPAPLAEPETEAVAQIEASAEVETGEAVEPGEAVDAPVQDDTVS